MMTDMQKMYAPFNITRFQKKIAYCNNEIIPLLLERGIECDMNTKRIIFYGRRFAMKDIDNGEAKKFALSLPKNTTLYSKIWKID